MRRLVVHQPTNHQSRRYRYYNYFWDLLCDELSKRHEVITNRYSKNIHFERQTISLLGHDNSTTDVLMMECEMIIQDIDTLEIYVLSVSDDFSHASLGLQDNPNLKKVFISQFDSQRVYSHLSNKDNFSKYSPWIYFPSNIFDIEKYYNLRKEKTLIDKFYFRGTSLEDRKIINHFDRTYFEGGLPIGGFDNYVSDLINYKVALSIAGRGEFCYRDVENMGMGIPMIRFVYKNSMYPSLIPNYHYIAVNRPTDLDWDRLGNEEHAKMITNRFLEVKDDTNFLEFISNNARNYYNDYLSTHNNVRHTIKLLDL